MVEKKKSKYKMTEKQLANLRPVNTLPKEDAKRIRQLGANALNKQIKEKKTLTECLKNLLEQAHTIKDQTKTGSEWLTVSLFQKALKGDVQAQKMIFDRIEGVQEQNLIVHNTPQITFEIIKKLPDEN
jgi:3-deoxy-D-manno-octulosonic-acid transferase